MESTSWTRSHDEMAYDEMSSCLAELPSKTTNKICEENPIYFRLWAESCILGTEEIVKAFKLYKTSWFVTTTQVFIYNLPF